MATSSIIPVDERIVNVAVVAPMLLTGLITNSVAAILIVKGKLRSSAAYLVSLIIADVIFLSTGPGLNLVRYSLGTAEWFLPNFYCKFFVFLSYAAGNSSAVIVACFWIDRFLTLCCRCAPFSLMKQLITIGVATTATTFYSSAWLEHVDVNSRGQCTYTGTRGGYLPFYVADLCAFAIIPTTFMTLTTCAMGYCRSNGISGPDMENAVSDSRQDLLPTDKYHDNLQPAVPANMEASTMSSRRMTVEGSKMVSKVVLGVLLVFVATCMPYRVLVVYNSFFYFLGSTSARIWSTNICRWLWYLSSAANPVVYGFASKYLN